MYFAFHISFSFGGQLFCSDPEYQPAVFRVSRTWLRLLHTTRTMWDFDETCSKSITDIMKNMSKIKSALISKYNATIVSKELFSCFPSSIETYSPLLFSFTFLACVFPRLALTCICSEFHWFRYVVSRLWLAIEEGFSIECWK